jgi:hypothetical protein
MSATRAQVVTPRLVLGLALMAFGTLFLLDELRIVDFDDIFRWWPVIPVAVGLTMIARPAGTASRAFGTLLAVFGVWQLLYDFDFIDFEFWDAWPLLLIGAGAWVVWRSLSESDEPFLGPKATRAPIAPAAPAGTARPAGTMGGASAAASAGAVDDPVAGGSNEDNLSAFAFIGHVEKSTTSKSFHTADLTAIMGGCTIDLRAADVGPDGAVIDAFAFWGGIKIIVPDDWDVTNKVLPLLGGSEDTSRATPGSTKQVLVRGSAIMGGVEITNHPYEE